MQWLCCPWESDNGDLEVVSTVRSATATIAHAVGRRACRPLLDVASLMVHQQGTVAGIPSECHVVCRLDTQS